MAVRIQLRRDTAANWVSTNPVLRAGELGIETDTLKIKIGNGSAWNSIINYANVVPSDFNTTLGDYVLVDDIGGAGGVVGLNNDLNAIIPGSSIIIEGSTDNSNETTLTVTDPTADRTITFPDATGTIALAENVAALSGATFTGNINVPTAITFEGATADSYETIIQATDPTEDRTITIPDATGTLALTSNIPSTTDGLSEGSTNKYFTDERAQDATAAALSAGTHTNITVTYDDNGNSISLAAAPGYVDEQAVDAVAASLAAGTHTNITVTYDDNGNSISLAAAPGYTDEQAQDAIGNSLGSGLSYNDSTGAISVDTATIQARVADVSDTEIGYLNGVTSAIQTQINTKAPINSPTFTGTVTLPGAPGSANEAATKAYVDNITAGLNFHAAAHVATTTNLTATYNNTTKTLTGSGAFPTIDGETITETQRVLVKSQSDAKENGIYDLTDDGDPSGSWVLTRSSDSDNSPSGEIAYGDFVFVQTGTTNGGYGFTMTTTGTITLGTSNINWTQFNAGQAVIAGNGLTESTPGTLTIDTTVTADLSTVQTLTNKTLTSPLLNAPVIENGINLGLMSGGTGSSGQVLASTGSALQWSNPITTSSTTTITSNSAVTLDTIALEDFVSAEYQVTIHQGTSSTRSSKLLVQTDGTSVDFTEYAIVATGTAIPGVAVSASVSSTNMILQATITNAATVGGRAFIVKTVTSGYAPSAPTIGTAVYGNTEANISFTAQDNGGSPVTAYTATSSPGGFTGTSTSSPVIVTGLTNGTAYTFTVTATNKFGTSTSSSPSNSVTPAIVPTVTGGTLYSDSAYYYRKFTTSSSLSITGATLIADVLTVAGGGGAGQYSGSTGGGGAGGIQYGSSASLAAGSYTITVGAGGAVASTGADSSVGSTYIAKGGGRGAGDGVANGGNGGSGGGNGGANTSGNGGSAVAGTGGTFYGNAGGKSTGSPGGYVAAAGGGGAGAAGAGVVNSSSGLQGGAGGIGLNTWSTWATATSSGASGYFAGGGAGGSVASNPTGGLGGGGNAGTSGSGGATNTGGGGGGGVNAGAYIGSGAGGGSGIVIFRYLKTSAVAP